MQTGLHHCHGFRRGSRPQGRVDPPAPRSRGGAAGASGGGEGETLLLRVPARLPPGSYFVALKKMGGGMR